LWTQHLKDKNIIEKVVAIDGKTVRGSKDTFHHLAPIHVVSAWSVNNGLCLGQCKTEEKSNEITAIPQLLELLEIKNCIITIDAMGTQHAIAQRIIEKKATIFYLSRAIKKHWSSKYWHYAPPLRR
jgi:hypothetical protein